MREIPAANDLLTNAQLRAVRRRSGLVGGGLVLHAWLMIGIACALVAHFPHPAIIVLAAMVIGSRQLGLVILMHEAAHGGLAQLPKLNYVLGQWFCAWPAFADLNVYRPYHLIHHTRTLTEDDPDIVLTGHYPISRASLRRKLIRDITGQSGYAQRKFQCVSAWRAGTSSLTFAERLQNFLRELGPALGANVILATLFALSGYSWLYLTCWLLPLLTWYQVVLRVRNIAEHAVVRGGGDPFGVARTTYANWIERILVAPYWVNYHLEHHLVMWAPCYRLRLLNRFLGENGYLDKLQTANGYLDVLREVTSVKIDEDVAGGRGAQGSFGQGYK